MFNALNIETNNHLLTLGLRGLTTQTFEVSPISADGQKVGSTSYVRSGLVGFLGPCGLVFVIGNKNTMMCVSGRWHSADDLIGNLKAHYYQRSSF